MSFSICVTRSIEKAAEKRKILLSRVPSVTWEALAKGDDVSRFELGFFFKEPQRFVESTRYFET